MSEGNSSGVGSSVGGLVGFGDGTLVGARVGFTVGALVGAGVGSTVGLRVGSGVGLFVGFLVGITDGMLVKTSVGEVVGSLDGAFVDFVGLSVGADEGVSVIGRSNPVSVGWVEIVGEMVGVCDGVRVGSMEGGFVGSVTCDGSGVGNLNGVRLGERLGERLGDLVGFLDGSWVGTFEWIPDGSSVGFPDGAWLGSMVGCVDGSSDGDSVSGGLVAGDKRGCVIGWEVVDGTVVVELPIFCSGSTITVKDVLEISTMTPSAVSSGVSSTRIAPLKSPGRKDSGSRNGNSTLLIFSMKSEFSLIIFRLLTASLFADISSMDGSVERVR